MEMNQTELYENDPVLIFPREHNIPCFKVISRVWNSKKIMVSKRLKLNLKLDKTFMLAIDERKRKIFIGKSLPMEGCIQCKFSRRSPNTFYSPPLVRMLTMVFDLVFSDDGSCTFTGIELVEYDGITIAVIDVSTADANVTAEAVHQ